MQEVKGSKFFFIDSFVSTELEHEPESLVQNMAWHICVHVYICIWIISGLQSLRPGQIIQKSCVWQGITFASGSSGTEPKTFPQGFETPCWQFSYTGIHINYYTFIFSPWFYVSARNLTFSSNPLQILITHLLSLKVVKIWLPCTTSYICTNICYKSFDSSFGFFFVGTF